MLTRQLYAYIINTARNLGIFSTLLADTQSSFSAVRSLEPPLAPNKVLLPLSKRLCFHLCLFVCLSV